MRAPDETPAPWLDCGLRDDDWGHYCGHRVRVFAIDNPGLSS